MLALGVRVTLVLNSSVAAGAARARHPRLDVLEAVETRDWTRVAAALTQLSQAPDAVLSFSHHFCAIAARAAAEARSRGFDAAILELAADKSRVRDALVGSTSALRHWTVESTEDVMAAAARIQMPAVVKPTADTSSTNVALVTDGGEFARAIAPIRSAARNRKGFAQSATALVEEYADGVELSVETMTWGDRTTVYGATIKTPLATHPFVEQADTFPCVDPTAAAVLDAAAADVIARLPGFSGPGHLEMRLTHEGPKLIEINARQPGGYLPALVGWTTGRDIFLETVCGLLDVQAAVRDPVARAATWWQIYPPRAGRISRCHVPEEVRCAHGVRHVTLGCLAGDYVDTARDNHGRIGDLLVCGDTPVETLARARRLAGEITIDMVNVSPSR